MTITEIKRGTTTNTDYKNFTVREKAMWLFVKQKIYNAMFPETVKGGNGRRRAKHERETSGARGFGPRSMTAVIDLEHQTSRVSDPE